MPPTGAFSQSEIDTFKAWIEQGAEWPDDVAGETAAAPPDSKALRITEALRKGDRRTVQRMVREDPKAASARAAGGATPLMYAALYGDADSVRLMLENGANPNDSNEAGATALMWAIDDPNKVELLLDRGANVNARTSIGRTPLLMAASRFGSSAVVKTMLDRGADPSAMCGSLFGPITPLGEAARSGDAEVIRMLLAKGANPKTAGFLPVYFAYRANCSKCLDLLLPNADKQTLTMAAMFSLPPFGDGASLQAIIARGADWNAKDESGQTMLLRIAHSDTLPLDAVKTLIDEGIDVNAKGPAGETALDIAKRRGDTAIVDLLVKAGAKSDAAGDQPNPQPKPAGSARAALQRSIPLLQKSDVIFFQKAGCVSCHNNTLTAMTVAAARKERIPVDEDTARNQLKKISGFVADWRDRVLQGIGIPGDADTISYILLGMAAENYAPDQATDAMAYFLKSQQAEDGRWRILAHRAPIESNDIQVTSATMRALQVYAPRTNRPEFQKAIQRASGWLATAQPRTTEERAFQLMGLGWSASNKDAIQRAARALIATQRADGGWSQLPSLDSDAYATGQALVALSQTGSISTSDPAYKRGVQFLLSTQLEDGSWFVRTRAVPIQPYFESGFPHGRDQWISMAATNWAALALVPVAR
jgi:ankyrin repeat protein